LDAVRKFDARKQVKIESYARHRIRGAMLDSLRSLDNASRDLRKKSKKVQRMCRDLEAKAGQPVDDERIASELGMSIEEWHRTMQELHAVGANGLRPTVSVSPKSDIAETLLDSQESPFDR
jgi:RNA polymerase sigma factor for flagellar operon FliA